MMLGRRSNDHSFNLREPSVPALVKAYIVSFPDRDAQQVVSKQRRRRTSKQQIVLTDVCSLTQTTISIYQSNKNIQLNGIVRQSLTHKLMLKLEVCHCSVKQILLSCNTCLGSTFVASFDTSPRVFGLMTGVTVLLSFWKTGEVARGVVQLENEPSRRLKLYIHGENFPLDETQVIGGLAQCLKATRPLRSLCQRPNFEDIGSFRGELLERLQEKREGL